MSNDTPRELLKCSFCGKSQKQVKKLIAGPGVYICDECINLCNEIIAEGPSWQWKDFKPIRWLRLQRGLRKARYALSRVDRALSRADRLQPLGSTGLAESLKSFTDEVGVDSGILFHHDIHDVDLPAPIALLIFHIAREGVMNALQHAHPTDVWIGVEENRQSVSLEVRDNGSGFDTTAPAPEGHFGIAMMRERANVGGGTLEIASARDEGTTIRVSLPRSFFDGDEAR